MAKPIVVVYMPENVSDRGLKSGWVLCGELSEQWNKEKPDYHWFVLLDYDTEKIYLQVFHEKDFTEIQYEELKQLIENQLKPTKN